MSPETTKELIEWLNVESILAKEDNSPIAASRLRDSAQRLRELEKDAARYQWLWTGFTPMGLNANGNHPWIFRTSPSELRGATLNQAIDAAMQSKENL